MESIEELFKDKGFSEEALKYLENAINEFEKLFGKYVSREGLIERVKKNIDIIEFKDELESNSSCAIGCYNFQQKKIQVMQSLDEEKKKSVFFHEFLHAEPADEDGTGFMRKYKVDLLDDSEEGLICTGRGVNEGFVQMMTQERDKKITGKVISKGYPILTALVKMFSNIFGKDELLDIYHNRSNEFIEFINTKIENDIEDIDVLDYNYHDDYSVSTIDFLEAFDYIKNHEEKITQRKAKAQRFKIMFGGNDDQYYYSKELIEAQEKIIQVYVEQTLCIEIESISQLNKVFEIINEIYSVFSKNISFETLRKIFSHCNPQILIDNDELKGENKVLMESYMEYKKFQEADTEGKIRMLAQRDEGIIIKLGMNLDEEWPTLEREFYLKMFSDLYKGLIDFSDKDCLMYFNSFAAVANYIVNNNLSFENLKIVYNDYFNDIVYEVYNFAENGEYKKIATLVTGESSNFEVKEYRRISLSDEKAIIEKYPQVVNITAGDESGNYIAYDLNGKQIFISAEYDEIENPRKNLEIESFNELKIKELEKNIQFHLKFIKKFQKFQYPNIFIEKEKEKIANLEQEKTNLIDAIRKASKEKIKPSKIEENTLNKVTIQSFKSTLESLLTQEQLLENEGGEIDVE
jgi:hypothetical protein